MDLRKNKNLKENKNNIDKIAKLALIAARKHVRIASGKRNIRLPRVMLIPKIGGFLPLIPIFAGLSILGSLAGAAANIKQSVRNINAAKDNIINQPKKVGGGIYLKRYRKGLGLYKFWT